MEERKRGQGRHIVVPLFPVSKARRPAYFDHVRCFVNERCQTLFPFFSVVASREERYPREEESFQFTLEPCLCLYNCAYFLWEEPGQRALNVNMFSINVPTLCFTVIIDSLLVFTISYSSCIILQPQL